MDNNFQEMVKRYRDEIMNMAKRGGQMPLYHQADEFNNKSSVENTQIVSDQNEEDIYGPAIPVQTNQQITTETNQQQDNNQQNNMQSNDEQQLEQTEINNNTTQQNIENQNNTAMPTPNIQEQTDMPIDYPSEDEIVIEDEPFTDKEEELMTYEQFRNINTSRGYLKLQAFAGSLSTPVQNVKIIISKQFSDMDRVFYTVSTNENGIVDNLELPTIDRRLSQSPTGALSFATYNVKAFHPDFNTIEFRQVPIFDGVKSIQPVRLIPRGINNQ